MIDYDWQLADPAADAGRTEPLEPVWSESENVYDVWVREFREKIVPEALAKKRHCEATEPCCDDVYCNCSCDACNAMECFRPGCSNSRGCKKRSHPDIRIWK